MKPLQLQIQGLHSFRQKQTVDFKTLCENGVFGIFGPTGSGKSSLLDAMTLALYGNVERASKTEGIMNQSENELRVSFMFSLGPSVYHIERHYKRTGEATMAGKLCRLTDQTEEPVVLAEKTKAVNQKIEELLGLTLDDFTRAVVLPQGKFAEFLHLGGSDRSKMLERLFHLEKYGNQLIASVKSRKTTAEQGVHNIEAEQQGLGPASNEDLKKAQEEHARWTKLVEQQQKQVEKYRKRYEEVKQKYQWTEELEHLKSSIQEWEASRPEIEKKRLTLKENEMYEALYPYADRLQKAAQEHREQEQDLKEKQKAHEKAKNKKQEAEGNAAENKKRWEEEERLVREWQRRYEQIETLEEEYQRLSELEKEKLLEMEKQRRLYEEASGQVTHLQKEEQKAQKLLEKLKQDFAAAEKKEEHLPDMDEASSQKQWLDALNQQLSEQMTQDTAAKEKLNDIARETSNADKEEETLQIRSRELAQNIYYWYDRAATHIRRVEQELKYVEKKQRAEQKRQLRILAEELQQGEACPLCGSTEHPSPAADPHEEVEEHVQEEMEALRQWKTAWENTKVSLQHVASTLSSGKEQIEETSPEEIEEGIVFTRWEAELATIDRLKEQTQELNRSWEEWRRQKDRLAMKIDQQKAHAEEQKRKLERLQNQWQKQKHQWEQSFAPLRLDQFEEEYKQAKERKEIIKSIQQRIEKGQNYLEKKRADLAARERQFYEVKSVEAVAVSEWKQAAKTREEAENKLNVQLEGRTRQEWKEAVDERAKKLETEKEALQRQEREAEKELERTRTSSRESEESLQKCAAKWKEAETEWLRQKQQKDSTAGPEEVLAYSLSEKQKTNLQQQVEEFDTKQKELQYEHSRLQGKLQNERVTEDVFNEGEKQYKEAAKEWDRYKETLGGIKEKLEDIKRKVERYQELEQNRIEMQAEKERLTELDQIMKGRKFVEFLAEEQLVQVTREASQRLHALTRGRYAIEVNEQNAFVIRDDANGGVYRPVSTLSGGETFLTSLALALSLSTSIQLKGQHPLEFFFLDEGFGTLDQDLLETVMEALENLHGEYLAVGVISHVPDMQQRVPKRLVVTPASPGGSGSTIEMETV
ncbi:AAA family ATPase [Marinococcus halophilus]|uniref:AAA family ATPase n=1 Tax=Marinococcus halophilus TaxID=1371 RepID=UPI0009A85894|nr:SbcC/MukB-like Walker B domain-containing protein [Marinococcus halophilus]